MSYVALEALTMRMVEVVVGYWPFEAWFLVLFQRSLRSRWMGLGPEGPDQDFYPYSLPL